ncbi:hypothetical protein Tco_0615099 [Tanacetum coccineum]
MSTQQDIYAAGSKNRPLMLNKENYVPWSSRHLRYAKSRPNGKLIYNSIINGPYVKRMIPEPGDQNHEVPVNETFHEQTDDELTEKELKQMVGGNGRNQFRQYTGQNVGNQNRYNTVHNVGNQNPNRNGLGHLARNCACRPRRRVAAYLQTQLLIAQKEEAGIQLQAEEFDLMAVVVDLDEIEEVNVKCILMANDEWLETASQIQRDTVTTKIKMASHDSKKASEHTTHLII